MKNARRHKSSKTIYAEQGKEYRRLNGGAFGKADPEVFNALVEGTSGQRRAEGDLDGSAQEKSKE